MGRAMGWTMGPGPWAGQYGQDHGAAARSHGLGHGPDEGAGAMGRAMGQTIWPGPWAGLWAGPGGAGPGHGPYRGVFKTFFLILGCSPLLDPLEPRHATQLVFSKFGLSLSIPPSQDKGPDRQVWSLYIWPRLAG